MAIAVNTPISLMVNQASMETRLACPTCEKENDFNITFKMDKISHCKACGTTFARNGNNAKTHDAYIKEFNDKVEDNVPEGTLKCRYCGSWHWLVNREEKPSHCARCNNNYPRYHEDVEVIQEVVINKFGHEVQTGKYIVNPNQELIPQDAPVLEGVKETFEMADANRYKYDGETVEISGRPRVIPVVKKKNVEPQKEAKAKETDKEKVAGDMVEDEGNVVTTPVAEDQDLGEPASKGEVEQVAKPAKKKKARKPR